jgi:hypothetical protein
VVRVFLSGDDGGASASVVLREIWEDFLLKQDLLIMMMGFCIFSVLLSLL